MICVPCRDRKRVAELCLPTLRDSKGPDDLLILSNDGSVEYGPDFLVQFGDVRSCRESIGIDAQRREHFNFFMRSEFTHLYLTDCDAIHDPEWRAAGLSIQTILKEPPVCLYNTLAHVRLGGNTIADVEGYFVIWRRVAPGISYLLTRAHVHRIVAALPHFPAAYHWDWTVPAILGHNFAVSRTCHVDHIGWGGERHPPGAGLDEGDRALSPTSWLVQKRAEIVAKLSL